MIAKLEDVKEKEGMKPQATLKGDEEFITVAGYLLVVDDSFKV
jgi:hypothetical protein